MQKTAYIIRGGVEGRERLRIVSRVMQPTTLSLLQRSGIRPGMACLDVGCGSGDLAFDLTRIVGPTGKVVATDIDETKLDLARRDAELHRLTNLEFQFGDITKNEPSQEFDLVHARFVLSHLVDPAKAVARMRRALRPAGVIVLQDVDFRGYFCHPDNAAVWRYVELYTETARRKGADANIGPRLPALLTEAGFENVHVNVVQPAGLEGEVKLLTPLTMENIADAVVAEGLASREEVDQLVAQLCEFAHTPGTIGCTPRIVEAWGTNPGR